MTRTTFLLLICSAVFGGCRKKDITGIDDHFFLRNGKADISVSVYSRIKASTFIILVHGGPGATALQYRSAPGIANLEEKMAVVYWDQRGGGNSRGNLTGDNISPEIIADDLKKLIILLRDRYGPGIGVYLMSHSWGGFPSALYLANEGARANVEGWINCAGVLDYPASYRQSAGMMIFEGNRNIKLGHHSNEWNEIVNYCSRIDSNTLGIQERKKINDFAFQIEKRGMISEMAPNTGDKNHFNEFMYHSPIDQVAAKVSGAMSNLWLALQSDNVSLMGRISDIKVPTLFIWGKYDFVVPSAQGIDAAPMIGTDDFKMYLFNFSGHNPFSQQPDAFVGLIEEFTEI